ncbi:MAG: hypothetical protein H6558_02970 [Lewinellaceae bacterium]|nr:hypothetical protein [Lewinellaceae bacterium]
MQNRVHTTSFAYAMPALVRDGETLRQPVNIEHVHLGAPAVADILMNGQKQISTTLHPGENKLSFLTEQVESPTSARVEIVLPGATTGHDILIKPVRHFEVYLLPHSHVDIGFTHKQAEVEQMQWRNFEQGIELARKTSDYPEGARYRWNVEVLWAVDGYLKNTSPEKREAFLDAVRKGWIGMDALYGSELTALQRYRRTDACRELRQPDRTGIWHPGRIRNDHRCAGVRLGHRARPGTERRPVFFDRYQPHAPPGPRRLPGHAPLKPGETFPSTGNLLPARRRCSSG